VLPYFSSSCIQACRATRHHILAFKEDKEIFDGVIAPTMRASVVPKPTPAQQTGGAIEDDDDDDMVVEDVQLTSKFSK